ncbi:MAG: esterase/lipase family protein [Wenzhouxiangellaceae bacterium]
MTQPSRNSPRKGRRRRFIPWRWLLLGSSAFAVWSVWSALNPQAERALRTQVHERLGTWFPEQMAPSALELGFVESETTTAASGPVEVVLVHGLDEPGGIWSELQQALDREGIRHVEFRYPNDQGIDASADSMARHWAELDSRQPVFLVGHSMGGLVIRDFVSRHRHPENGPSALDGPAVGGVILIATPNHGSEWARLRAWLEIREFAADLPSRRFSLFAALRDGTGAAKIDLTPGSEYLRELNTRSWPEHVPVRIIGGRLTEPTEQMKSSLTGLSSELGLPELERSISGLWQSAGESIGDGAVAVDSLRLHYAPDPLILEASHRGLIASMPWSDAPPPAIEPVIGYLEDWRRNLQQESRRHDR